MAHFLLVLGVGSQALSLVCERVLTEPLPSCSYWLQLSCPVLSSDWLTFAAPNPPAWKTFFFFLNLVRPDRNQMLCCFFLRRACLLRLKIKSPASLTRCFSFLPLAAIHFPYLHAYLHNVLFQQTEPASLCSTFFFSPSR